MTKRKSKIEFIAVMPIASFFCAMAILLSPALVQAGSLGLPHARSAEFSNMPDRTIEAGYVLQNNFQTLSFRYSHKVHTRIVLQAEIGVSQLYSAVGVPLGAAFYLDLSDQVQRFDLGLRASAFTASHDFDGIDADSNSTALDVILGLKRDPESLKLHRWYVSLGVQQSERGRVLRQRRQFADNTQLTVEAGVTYPAFIIGRNRVGNIYGGELFAVLRQEERLQFAFGARYHF